MNANIYEQKGTDKTMQYTLLLVEAQSTGYYISQQFIMLITIY